VRILGYEILDAAGQVVVQAKGHQIGRGALQQHSRQARGAAPSRRVFFNEWKALAKVQRFDVLIRNTQEIPPEHEPGNTGTALEDT
jgi:predicted RNA-binding protein YlxR (DUF448 family)